MFSCLWCGITCWNSPSWSNVKHPAHYVGKYVIQVIYHGRWWSYDSIWVIIQWGSFLTWIFLHCTNKNINIIFFIALTHWGQDKIAAISQMTFSNAFSWMKMHEFSHKISLKFVPTVHINSIPALVQIMAWCRPGDKPLSEPMMVSLLTHVCITQPQWVKQCCIQHECDKDRI